MEKNLILTKNKLIKRRVDSGEGIPSAFFYGKMKDQISPSADYVTKSNGERLNSIVVPAGEKWVNSEGYAKTWDEIEGFLKKVKARYERGQPVNINQFPDDYYDLINRIRIDITRRRTEQADYTGEMTQEITNPNFSKAVDLTEFLDYAGVFEEIKGTGDNVPMIEQKTGALGAVHIILHGLGHARTLEDELYNLDIFSLEKVNKAVARAHTALRNDLCLGVLVAMSIAGTWNPSQQIAASTIGTIEERVYTTINNAIYLLGSLLDVQTNQEIDTSRMVLVVGTNAAARVLNRVINGRLLRGENKIINLEPLEIDEIWNYKGDSITVGPKVTTYPGVPAHTGYLFVPGPAGAPIWTLNKRQLTQEIGRGDVLQLARERRAWYFGQGNYMDEFLGSSGLYNTGETAIGSGYGYCIEISIPHDEET